MFEEQKKSAVDKKLNGYGGFKRRTTTIFIKLENSTRLMMVLYGLVFYETMTWFMALEAPNNAQSGFVSVVVGAGANWFGLYVNGKSSKIQKSKEQVNGCCSITRYYITTTRKDY